MDPLDDAPVGFYTMLVFAYDTVYVGLLWMFHNSSSWPAGSILQLRRGDHSWRVMRSGASRIEVPKPKLGNQMSTSCGPDANPMPQSIDTTRFDY